MGYSIVTGLGNPYNGNIYSCNRNKIGTITFHNDKDGRGKDSFDFVPESDVEVSLSYELKNAQDLFINKVSGAKIIGSALNGLASLTEASQYSSSYAQFPVSSNKIEAGISSSLVMNFKYGYLQQWNAGTEVVTPILAIVKRFLISYDDNEKLIKGPWKSEGELIQHAIKCMLNAAKGVASKAPPNPPATENADTEGSASGNGNDKNQKQEGTATASTPPAQSQEQSFDGSLQQQTGDLNSIDFNDKNDSTINAIVKALDHLASKLYNAYDGFIRNEYTKGIFFDLNIGGVTYTNLYASGISWKFDTSEVDVNGRPLSGQVTLSGIKFVMLPRTSFVKGYTVGL